MTIKLNNNSIDFNKTTKLTLQEDLLIVSIINDSQKHIDDSWIKEYFDNKVYNTIFILSNSNKDIIYKFEEENIPFLICNGDFNEKLLKGFEFAIEAGYKYVVEFDIDNQYTWKDIPLMHEKAIQGYDLVIGDRIGNSSFNNSKLNKKLSFFLKWKFISLKDPLCNFRLFNWIVIKYYLDNKNIRIEPYSYVKLKKTESIKIVGQPIRIRKNTKSWVDKENSKISYVAKQILKIIF